MQIKTKKRYIMLFFLVLITAIISILVYKNTSKLMNPIKHQNQYTPKVLVIYKEGTENYLDIYHNYSQSYILNIETIAISDKEFENINLLEFDVVYPDISLITSDSIDKIQSHLIYYAQHGGYLFLEYDWHNVLPQNITNIVSIELHNSDKFEFNYPKTKYNLEQLQLVVKSFLNNFTEYRNEDLKSLKFSKLHFNNNATKYSIANINNNSIMYVNKIENTSNSKVGYILMCSNLLPNDDLITGFDLTAKVDTQEYFDYSFTTINYFVRNEFLAFALKEKYGFALKKIYGPYGRPAMAWQNHYEALTSIKEKEMIDWIDLLKDYNQIPSMSLVRSTFDWGKWYSDITVHINSGTNKNPEFIGEYEDSYYSSGKRIALKDDYLTFGEYPIYTSLKSPIVLPHRAYPSIVDYENDGDKDLIVGADDGKIYLVRNTGTKANPLFHNKEYLNINVGSFASPFVYDINKDNLFDLVIGNGEGHINVFINNGSKNTPEFLESYKLKSQNHIIKTKTISAPAIGDLDNDGIDDLIIGTGIGHIEFYKGTKHGYEFKNILSNNGKYSAPTIYDWNNDGQKDILVGDNSGYIKIYINNNANFEFDGYVKGQTKNMYGNHNLLGGHNSVPLIADWNNDSITDLLVGQLEFGISYNIDGEFFKYKDELKQIIKYAKEHGVPIYPHFYTHQYKSPEQEKRELELQEKAFEYYDLEWNSGIDQHTWQTNRDSSQQTLNNELYSGIWWNFGFNPPNQPDLPRDGKEFMWSTPFLLTNKTDTNKFISFTPSPNLFMYPKAYDSFAQLDMPVIYFEHIEYRFKNPHKLDELKQMANFLNVTRDTGEYNFVTQEQMAKSFINTFYSKASVKLTDNAITIQSNTKNIPSEVKEYKETLGLKFEKGEKLKDLTVYTTSPIHYEKESDLYFGLFDKTELVFSSSKEKDNHKLLNDSFYILRSNVPIKISTFINKTKIRFLDWGMQQIKIEAFNPIEIRGERVKIEQDGNYYTITHYGYPITVEIKNK